jgi:phosphatidylglycerophosphate synthase
LEIPEPPFRAAGGLVPQVRVEEDVMSTPSAVATGSAPPALARRELQGLTSALEGRALAWLAARTPARIGPDHLTALGLAAMMGAGVLYALSSRFPAALLLVNVCLALNWLGDSLDGSVARYRRRQRPRYGFFIDHLVDAVGALCVLAGLAASGLMSPTIAWSLLVGYYLLSIDLYLAAHTVGTFKLSFGAVGGTELRLLLAAANTAVWLRPSLGLFGAEVLVFDLIGGAAVLGLAATVVSSAIGVSRRLAREEALP